MPKNPLTRCGYLLLGLGLCASLASQSGMAAGFYGSAVIVFTYSFLNRHLD